MKEQLKQNIVEHKDIKSIVLRVEDKLDKVVEDKLDKKVFEEYKNNNRSWIQWVPAVVCCIAAVVAVFV